MDIILFFFSKTTGQSHQCISLIRPWTIQTFAKSNIFLLPLLENSNFQDVRAYRFCDTKSDDIIIIIIIIIRAMIVIVIFAFSHSHDVYQNVCQFYFLGMQ